MNLTCEVAPTAKIIVIQIALLSSGTFPIAGWGTKKGKRKKSTVRKYDHVLSNMMIVDIQRIATDRGR